MKVSLYEQTHAHALEKRRLLLPNQIDYNTHAHANTRARAQTKKVDSRQWRGTERQHQQQLAVVLVLVKFH